MWYSFCVPCPQQYNNDSLSLMQRDAGEYFMINSSTGFLYQTKHFDYETTTIQCEMGKLGGFLNVTAEVTIYHIYHWNV